MSPTELPDAFDALRADTTPIDPPTHVRARLRAALETELELLMTQPAVISAAHRMPADTTVINTVQPYLSIAGAAAAIDFYVDAFGAVEHHRLVEPDGRIGHAEIVIGDSRLALADEYPDYDALGPISRGGTSVRFTVSVPTVEILESMFARALELGATLVRPIADQFYGHRTGALIDPFGHHWNIGTPIPGFGDDDYREQSAEIGLTLTPVATAPAPADDHAHQVKAYARGDLYYFTLQVPDVDRAKAFFGAALGWEFPDPQGGHIGNISAPPGGIAAAESGAAPLLYFVVDDIEATAARIRELGGTTADPVHYESGWDLACTDDQGTPFHLSIPAPHYRA
jgi:uncharacterized glyoxalase superfamily protein PhnB/predicted enzyme related to lactoylglutathione lyase